MRPPKRQKKNVETKETPGDVLWTLQELKALLGALKSCPVNDYAAIQKYLPERSLNEVKVNIERFRGQNPGRLVGTHEAAPIEKWRQKSEQLQKFDVDHSRVLSQVMSTMATLEPQTRKRGACDPNYHAVYRYLAALMNKESPPGLTKMDAIVLLDILDGLADHLTSLDTSDQQAMMRQKYTLLKDRVNLYSQKSVLVAVKKQLKEDTSESSRQPPTADSLQDPPESSNGTASTSTTTTTGSSDRGDRAHTTNVENSNGTASTTTTTDKVDTAHTTNVKNSNGTASTTTGSSDGGDTAHTTNVPLASDGSEASGNITKGDHNYDAETPWVSMSAGQRSKLQKSPSRECTVQERIEQDRIMNDTIMNMCGLYNLNPFCIEQKYFQPGTNPS